MPGSGLSEAPDTRVRATNFPQVYQMYPPQSFATTQRSRLMCAHVDETEYCVLLKCSATLLLATRLLESLRDFCSRSSAGSLELRWGSSECFRDLGQFFNFRVGGGWVSHT